MKPIIYYDSITPPLVGSDVRHTVEVNGKTIITGKVIRLDDAGRFEAAEAIYMPVALR